MSLNKLIPGSLPALLQFFGITPEGREDFSFRLRGDVIPVAIAGSVVSLTATSTEPLLGTPFTAGEVINPGANAVLADTGAQNAGNYTAIIMVGSDYATTASIVLRLQRRDAANAASIWSHYWAMNMSGMTPFLWKIRLFLAASERLRVLNVNACTETAQVNIWLVPDGS